MAAERSIQRRWRPKSLFRAALMEIARAVKVEMDMNGVIATAMGPSSVAFSIDVPPVTAVMTVQAANA